MIDLLSISPTPSFSLELPKDNELENYPRNVIGACYSFVKTVVPSNPLLLHVSTNYLEELDLEINDDNEFLNVMSGAKPFNGFEAYAMCYGGHQFGNWAGQLGDGRAINIAEIPLKGNNLKLQLKGSGPTPYSRTADGLAVLRSSVREYLCSEAMHHLGVPTTRAMSLVKTGDMVPRDILYNGNVQEEEGAVVCRVSPSFIRFGNFEIASARGDIELLKKLVDYTIKHHYSHLGAPSKETYLAFFREVTLKTKDMIVGWQRVGFVHGVMNTDNLSILGLTIDYGPYGWLENYAPSWTPNTTDSQHKRYRYGNQPNIGLWNLTQLANALYPLIEDVESFQSILSEYKTTYLKDNHQMMLSKVGLYQVDEIPETFVQQLTGYMESSQLDMTMFFRELSSSEFKSFEDLWRVIEFSTYLDLDVLGNFKGDWKKWFIDYSDRLTYENVTISSRLEKMKAVNPKYVLRNYMAQLAINDAEEGGYNLIDELYQMLLKPYDEQPEYNKWYAKRPDWAKNKVGCSMLSCSS